MLSHMLLVMTGLHESFPALPTEVGILSGVVLLMKSESIGGGEFLFALLAQKILGVSLSLSIRF